MSALCESLCVCLCVRVLTGFGLIDRQMSKSVSVLKLHSYRDTTPEGEIPSCQRQKAFMTSLLMSAYMQTPTLMSCHQKAAAARSVKSTEANYIQKAFRRLDSGLEQLIDT